MARFQEKHLKLKYNERSYFGTNDECSIWHDGTQLRVSCTISGVTPTQDYHLTTKQYVDEKTQILDRYFYKTTQARISASSLMDTHLYDCSSCHIE